jgi:hypothetical protein
MVLQVEGLADFCEKEWLPAFDGTDKTPELERMQALVRSFADALGRAPAAGWYSVVSDYLKQIEGDMAGVPSDSKVYECYHKIKSFHKVADGIGCGAAASEDELEGLMLVAGDINSMFAARGVGATQSSHPTSGVNAGIPSSKLDVDKLKRCDSGFATGPNTPMPSSNREPSLNR